MKHKKINIIIIVIAALVLAGTLLTKGAQHFLNKSPASIIYEQKLKQNNKKFTASFEEQRLEGREADLNKDALKSVSFREDLSLQEWDGLKTYYLNSINQSGVTIIYFHSGDFTDGVSKDEWAFLNRVAEETDAEIIVPDYRLAPSGSYGEAVLDIKKLCIRYMNELDFRRFFFMGEGSGCSLMLEVNEELAFENERSAEVLFMYSPWIDLSLGDPDIEAYDEADLYHSREALLVDAKAFAREMDLEDPYFDFINGTLKLPKTYIYCGKKDLFYPGTEDFIAAQKEAGTEIYADTRDAMSYGYAQQNIPEAEQVLEHIEYEINNP